jgi:hypothetical protein
VKSHQQQRAYLLQPPRLQPRTNGLGDFVLALKREPVAAREMRHRKIPAGEAHWLAKAATIDVADSVPLAVNEEHGLL